ncbi:MAG: tetratricopeptide repeat protein [Bdellovibrionales bacterium]|nr:tetratricopeptide repeat protein [Bdellovibrionales bacterium]
MIKRLHLCIQWCKTWKALPVFNWIRGAKSFRSGKFREAALLYERGLKSHPHHPAALCARLDLAYCYFRLRRFQDADDQLKVVLTKAPTMREAYLRLARMQLWTGQAMSAAWTLRRALREFGTDADLVSTFLQAVLDNGGPNYLLQEGVEFLKQLPPSDRASSKLEIAAARLAIFRGDYKTGRGNLARLTAGATPPFEALVAYAEALIAEGRIAHSRQQLRRALQIAPDHPRVLSLFAESYLKSGPFYNPEFARQLALSACQNSGWCGPREMHILAEAYLANNERITALAVAHKAKEAGTRLLGNYRDVRTIDKLIEALSQNPS